MNPTPPEPTPEQMLARVIEAQVAGGCEDMQELLDDYELIERRMWSGKKWGKSFGVIEILLDPEGLRAAYSGIRTLIETGDEQKDLILNAVSDELKARGRLPEYWEWAAQIILLAWLSTPEGNPTAAIKTAFDLLPPKHDTR